MTEDDAEFEEIKDPLEQFREEWEAYRKERNDKLHRFFFKVMVIFALLGVTVSATVIYVWITSENNRKALCAIRHDAERRYALGEQFLKDNPNGIAGISASQLRVSINNSKETADSLSIVHCASQPKVTPTPTTSP